jgi:hypothetical protein
MLVFVAKLVVHARSFIMTALDELQKKVNNKFSKIDALNPSTSALIKLIIYQFSTIAGKHRIDSKNEAFANANLNRLILFMKNSPLIELKLSDEELADYVISSDKLNESEQKQLMEELIKLCLVDGEISDKEKEFMTRYASGFKYIDSDFMTTTSEKYI